MTGCFGSGQNTVNQGLAEIEFATITLQFGNTNNFVDRDVLVRFNRPHRVILVGSITQAFATCGIFMHFSPAGYAQNNATGGGNIIVPTGGERWICFSNKNNGTIGESRFIKLYKPIQQFYVDVDHANVLSATPFLITFIGCDDIDQLVAERQ